MLTVNEAAERLGITRAAVYIAIKDGRLRSEKKYGRVLVRERDVDSYAQTVGQRNGWVKRTKGPVGKAFLYTPLRRPGRTYRRVVGDVLQRIFGGNGPALVASLFETQPPTPDEIVELQRLLDGLRRKIEPKE